MGLYEFVNDEKNKPTIVTACCQMIDEEVASKGGLSGFALKAGYKAIQGVKPNFIRHAVVQLLPDFAKELEPLWEEGVAKGGAAAHLVANRARAAEAMLRITDAKVKLSTSSLVRGTYDKLRDSAKKNVEDAIPRLAKVLEKHVK